MAVEQHQVKTAIIAGVQLFNDFFSLGGCLAGGEFQDNFAAAVYIAAGGAVGGIVVEQTGGETVFH